MKGWLGALSVWWRLSFALLLVHQFQIKDEVLAITGNLNFVGTENNVDDGNTHT